MHRDAQQMIDFNSLLDHELYIALKTNAALIEEHAEAHAAFSERSYDADRKHELTLSTTVDASCERANIAAQVVESMHRDAQQHIDESGLLEYELGDAKEVIVVFKKQNIQASDLLNRLRSDKALSDVHMQRLSDSIRAKRTRVSAFEPSTSQIDTTRARRTSWKGESRSRSQADRARRFHAPHIHPSHARHTHTHHTTLTTHTHTTPHSQPTHTLHAHTTHQAPWGQRF